MNTSARNCLPTIGSVVIFALRVNKAAIVSCSTAITQIASIVFESI